MRAPLTSLHALCLTVLLAAFAALPFASAQLGLSAKAFVLDEELYVEAAPLARALGVVVQLDDSVLTWRGPFGPVTMFASSATVLAQVPGRPGSTDVTLMAPVLDLDSGWFVPLDAFPLLGVEVPTDSMRPAQLDMPDGRSVELEYVTLESVGLTPNRSSGVDAAVVHYSGRASWEATEEPLVGVRFFDGDGVSLLLVDLALVPIARPELTADVDKVLEQARAAGSDHVLLLLVTAVAELPWNPALVFTQDDRRLEVRPPYRMLIESGDEGGVAPDAPVLGAVLLPNTFSLYRPMHVSWAGAQAEVRFRR